MNTRFSAAFAIACPLLTLSSAQAQNGACNRACLEGVMSNYLAALAAHDPSKLAVAANVKYAENDQIGAPGKYRHVFSDPQSGQVAAIITHSAEPVRSKLRFRVTPDVDIGRDTGG